MGCSNSKNRLAVDDVPDTDYGTDKQMIISDKIQQPGSMIFKAKSKIRCSGVVQRDFNSLAFSDIGIPNKRE
ncbi:hypothetical protein SS50377_20365 [Spironucleus salmonicida]|uniref:Uncharacterized protein n=1 Tax=Spironucleus salmonicida TaxID=348837 RepID=A0A9P8LZX5_9EUKA|nr:hypothetical protein SS50377_20365 [Spironucleus salmonicida]